MRSHPLRFGRYDRMVHGPVAAALPFITAGMTVLGAATSALGAIQQGNAAAANAQLRNQQMQAQARQQENEAEQNRAAANNAAAVGQREAIEARRKGMIMAGRAQTVMAASGAGVDPSMTAGLLAEGDYAGDVALYQGEDKARVLRNMGKVNEFNADTLRAGGQAGIWSAEQTKGAFTTAAIGSAFKGIAGAGMGLAAAYGGSDGVSATSPGSAMAAYKDLPVSQRAPGFDDQWGVT